MQEVGRQGSEGSQQSSREVSKITEKKEAVRDMMVKCTGTKTASGVLPGSRLLILFSFLSTGNIGLNLLGAEKI